MGSKRVEAFKNAVCALCREYGFSIGHEDSQGGFLIVPYSEENIQWFLDAWGETGSRDK